MSAEPRDLNHAHRSECDVVADAIWSLVKAKMLTADAVTVRQACNVVGINVDDLRVASLRWDRGVRARPTQHECEPDRLRIVAPIQAKNAGKRLKSPQPKSKARVRRELEAQRDPMTRRCSMCEEYLPIAKFRQIKNEPGRAPRYKSFCLDCEREYQRSRYLTIEKAKIVETAVRIVFELREGDLAVGHRCKSCFKELRAGDRVVGEVELVHEECRP